MRILVTGGNGFIGKSVVAQLSATAQVCAPKWRMPTNPDSYQTQPNNTSTQLKYWNDALSGKDTIIHLAGRAHVIHDSSIDPLSEFRAINVQGTINLARLASQNAVKRFVFISSIGVNGGKTNSFGITEGTTPAPHADYALSKWEAERALEKVAREGNMEIVIIRPPLVYASHAPGNFGRLLRLVKTGIPLPLASIKNQRSMIALENLVDFITLCTHHPSAANQLFVISDGISVSTPDIIRYLARGMDQSARLFPVPQSLLRAGASLLGKAPLYSQLCESLVVDPTKAQQLLKWKPIISADEALVKAGTEFKNSN